MKLSAIFFALAISWCGAALPAVDLKNGETQNQLDTSPQALHCDAANCLHIVPKIARSPAKRREFRNKQPRLAQQFSNGVPEEQPAEEANDPVQEGRERGSLQIITSFNNGRLRLRFASVAIIPVQDPSTFEDRLSELANSVTEGAVEALDENLQDELDRFWGFWDRSRQEQLHGGIVVGGEIEVSEPKKPGMGRCCGERAKLTLSSPGAG